jgi:hypothetical protein
MFAGRRCGRDRAKIFQLPPFTTHSGGRRLLLARPPDYAITAIDQNLTVIGSIADQISWRFWRVFNIGVGFSNMTSFAFGRRVAAVLLAGAGLAGTAQAATQGNLGASSTGTVVINASVPAQVRISGLSDVNFTAVNPNNDAANAQNVCVWSNNANKRYNITASGSGTGSAFALTSTGLAEIPYSVEWDDVSGATSGAGLTSGTALGNQTSAANNPSCTGLANESASLIVKVAATNLQAMQAETTYTGTLTLTVAPE